MVIWIYSICVGFT